MTAVIREATVGDVPGMYRAWQDMRQHNASLDQRIQLVPVSESEFGIALREVMERPTSAVFVAEAAGDVVGFISGAIEQNQPDRLPERHVTVGYLFVDPKHRRGGMGRGLVQQLRDWAAKQDGVSHIEMTVIARDEAATGFWQSLGFTPFIQRLWAPLDASDEQT